MDVDPRIAEMLARRNAYRGGDIQPNGLSLPEQLPAGPREVDPNMMRMMAMRMRNEQQAPPPINQAPVQPQMGQPQPVQAPQSMQRQRPMGQPTGTPAQMPMANTMNPNAPSARPSFRNRMGQQNQRMGQQQRSITPFQDKSWLRKEGVVIRRVKIINLLLRLNK